MNEILDEIKTPKNSRTVFSKLSFISAIITLNLIAYLFSCLPTKIKVGVTINPPMVLIMLIYIFCFTGIITTILSFIQHEPSKWYKWLGGVINGLVFLSIIFSAIFIKSM